MKLNRTTLRSTLAALIAFLIAYGPDIVTWLGGLQEAPHWLRGVTKGIGILVGLCTAGKAVALLNLVLPDGPATNAVQPAAPLASTTPTPVTTPLKVLKP